MKKRDDGRYEQKVYIGKKPRLDANGEPVVDESGKAQYIRQYVTVYGATQREVKEKGAQLKIQHGKGVDITAANDSFGTWADRFIAQKETEGLTAAYITALKSRRAHLKQLDSAAISKITTGDIQAIINRLSDYHEGKRPLAKRTLHSINDVAYQIFELAIMSRVLSYNPAKYVTISKATKETKREALTREQQQWVNTPLMVKRGKELVDHRARLAAMIMMYAGLRRGELIALTWADINLEAGTIRVNKAVEFDNGLPKLKGTKTSAGDRTVDIPDVLVDYLKSIRHNDNCLYVVHQTDGSMHSTSSWRSLWASYMADLNVKYGYSGEASKHHPDGLTMKIRPFTAHQLRHTFATLLYLSGTDVLVAKEQMGHRNIETTLGIYSHLDKEHKRKSVTKLNDYISSSNVRQGDKKDTV